MLRNTITGLMMLSLLVGVAAGAGGCNKEKREERKRQKAALKQQKLEEKQQKDAERKAAKSGGKDMTPQNKFESSDDPPLNAETRFAAGQLAESQGNYDNAIAQYREALKLSPNHRDSMFRLGAVYTQTKRYNEAIPLWQRYIKATNNAAQSYSNLALCYEMAGRPAEAEQTYKAGIERDPKDPSCRVNYGLMLARQNKSDDAIAQLSTVLRPAEVHYNLGAVREQQGKREEAKAYYRKALELDPNLRDARSRLAALK